MAVLFTLCLTDATCRRFTGRLAGALILAVLALPVLAPPALARRPAAITGRLTKPGYTVIALPASGKATLVRARRGNFRLVPPAETVTLQLRGPSGRYAGPIVVGGNGTRAITGVRAGARLGRVVIDTRKGYAKLARRLPRRWLDASRWARARRGVPIGNGRNFGFVRSRPPRGLPSGDRDADGVPDTLDIAAGGDLILNNFKRARRARAAQVDNPPCDLACQAGVALGAHLPLTLEHTVNANAPGTITQDPHTGVWTYDAALQTFGLLQIGFPPGGTTELDCGGAIYCLPHSQGGTGTVAFGPSSLPPNAPFPDCCLAADSFGLLSRAAFAPGLFFLAHGSTTAQIGTGKVLTERVTAGAGSSECLPTGSATCWSITLQDIFATVPALISYHDGAGHSATVSYPLPAPYTGSPPGPGDPRDGFPVASCPAGAPAPCVAGDVVLTFTVWRPQRKPITADANGAGGDACLKDSQPCQWVDIGGLLYAAVPQAQVSGGLPFCPQSAFSTTDPQLTPEGIPYSGGAFRDSAGDRSASPANTLTFSVNVTACLASHGLSWDPGEGLEIRLVGTNGFDRAEQRLYFKRP